MNFDGLAGVAWQSIVRSTLNDVCVRVECGSEYAVRRGLLPFGLTSAFVVSHSPTTAWVAANAKVPSNMRECVQVPLSALRCEHFMRGRFRCRSGGAALFCRVDVISWSELDAVANLLELAGNNAHMVRILFKEAARATVFRLLKRHVQHRRFPLFVGVAREVWQLPETPPSPFIRYDPDYEASVLYGQQFPVQSLSKFPAFEGHLPDGAHFDFERVLLALAADSAALAHCVTVLLGTPDFCAGECVFTTGAAALTEEPDLKYSYRTQVVCGTEAIVGSLAYGEYDSMPARERQRLARIKNCIKNFTAHGRGEVAEGPFTRVLGRTGWVSVPSKWLLRTKNADSYTEQVVMDWTTFLIGQCGPPTRNSALVMACKVAAATGNRVLVHKLAANFGLPDESRQTYVRGTPRATKRLMCACFQNLMAKRYRPVSKTRVMPLITASCLALVGRWPDALRYLVPEAHRQRVLGLTALLEVGFDPRGAPAAITMPRGEKVTDIYRIGSCCADALEEYGAVL